MRFTLDPGTGRSLIGTEGAGWRRDSNTVPSPNPNPALLVLSAFAREALLFESCILIAQNPPHLEGFPVAFLDWCTC